MALLSMVNDEGRKVATLSTESLLTQGEILSLFLILLLITLIVGIVVFLVYLVDLIQEKKKYYKKLNEGKE